MTYPPLVVIMLAATAVVVVLARRRLAWRAVGLTVAVLAVLTVVFDNVMIAADLFTYGDGTLLGPRIGRMPVEDLAYAVVAGTLLPALWHLLPARRSPDPRSPAPRSGGGRR